MKFWEMFEKIFKRKEVPSEPYVEKDTKCDKCQYLQECIENGYVLNCSRTLDERNHYIVGLGSHCKQDFNMIMSAIKDGVGVSEEIIEDMKHYGIEECNHGLPE